MKNFKLLLATTAILSTATIAANATLSGISDSVSDFEVKAEIVNDLNLEAVDPLDFGRIAWDFSNADHTVALTPNSTGDFTPTYYGVKFHDGGSVGKVCFTDLVPDTTLEEGVYIEISSITLYDNNNVTIGDIDFSLPRADAGATQGTRCVYIGGQLTFENVDAAKNFSGNIEKTTTVTVMYDSVNN